MCKKKYVLHLIEDSIAGYGNVNYLGYWTGKKYYGDDICFPGVEYEKNHENVKTYTSLKRAENAVKKLGDTFTFISTATIETLD